MPVETYGGFINDVSLDSDVLCWRFHSDVVESGRIDPIFSRTKQKHWRSHFAGLSRKNNHFMCSEKPMIAEKDDPDYRKDFIMEPASNSNNDKSNSNNDISLSDMAFSMDVGDEIMEFEGWTLSTDHYL
mmetsp:Transcript_31470/g.100730  ORF Transcript_31470/g.100730 Transcript_31470/m.100730 type:complete len:129 (-) Transcript_31470:88-474(-)